MAFGVGLGFGLFAFGFMVWGLVCLVLVLWFGVWFVCFWFYGLGFGLGFGFGFMVWGLVCLLLVLWFGVWFVGFWFYGLVCLVLTIWFAELLFWICLVMLVWDLGIYRGFIWFSAAFSLANALRLLCFGLSSLRLVVGLLWGWIGVWVGFGL